MLLQGLYNQFSTLAQLLKKERKVLAYANSKFTFGDSTTLHNGSNIDNMSSGLADRLTSDLSVEICVQNKNK